MIIKNKKAGEKYLSIWWFFILAVIGVGLVAGVAIFNSRTIDSRSLEADILAVKIIDCLVEQGYIKLEILETSFDIYETCHLSKDLIEKSGLYFFSFEIYDPEQCDNTGCKKIGEEKKYGVYGFKEDCKISQGISAGEYPRCSEKKIYTSDKKGKRLLLVVTAGTNNKGGRIAGI